MKRYTGYKWVCRKIIQWQCSCAALLGNSTGLEPLRFKLKELRIQITIQWIPGHSDILGNVMEDSVDKHACSENAQLPGVTYICICARTRHMVKDPPIQHEKRLRFIARAAPPENARYEEQTRLYWQNSVLESTKDYALIKAS